VLAVFVLEVKIAPGESEHVNQGKAVPVTGREGPYDCEASRFPHFLDNRRRGCQPYAPAALYPREDSLVLISVRD
jgi:hypothetical protein